MEVVVIDADKVTASPTLTAYPMDPEKRFASKSIEQVKNLLNKLLTCDLRSCPTGYLSDYLTDYSLKSKELGFITT